MLNQESMTCKGNYFHKMSIDAYKGRCDLRENPPTEGWVGGGGGGGGAICALTWEGEPNLCPHRGRTYLGPHVTGTSGPSQGEADVLSGGKGTYLSPHEGKGTYPGGDEEDLSWRGLIWALTRGGDLSWKGPSGGEGDGDLSGPSRGEGDLSGPSRGEGDLSGPSRGEGDLSGPSRGEGDLSGPSRGEGDLSWRG